MDNSASVASKGFGSKHNSLAIPGLGTFFFGFHVAERPRALSHGSSEKEKREGSRTPDRVLYEKYFY
jgi:hypothetical protein